ncbi:MAG: molybdopterin-dependent oxidoreductase, partial [Spirochaetales bacterium]|nr:molybdopterin-dependent oxidoreductase [Spirochaetales bacterium]
NIPVGKIRVIKPYIGGGFGNKQDVVLEPMAAFLTKKLNGRYVKIDLTRSECMISTRNRHPFNVDVKLGVQKDGTITAFRIAALSITGAYASHGHSIISAGTSKSCVLYPRSAIEVNAKTIYANIPVAGAMRAYGSPQIVFPLESIVEDAARKIGMDSVEFRLKNVAKTGDINPLSNKVIETSGLSECLIKGKELIDWDRKQKELANSNTGPVRRGLGVACFSYGSGTYPVCVEIAGVRIILNQDGSVHVQTGAVEIGQGSDTVIAQMVAETIGLSVENVHIVSTQDTDVTPFDPGAYASRQTYVVSNAVFEAAEEIEEKIITYAKLITNSQAKNLTIVNGNVVSADNTEKVVISLQALAIDSYYHKDRGGQITADVSHKTRTNAFSYGCTFVDLTVDIP